MRSEHLRLTDSSGDVPQSNKTHCHSFTQHEGQHLSQLAVQTGHREQGVTKAHFRSVHRNGYTNLQYGGSSTYAQISHFVDFIIKISEHRPGIIKKT